MDLRSALRVVDTPLSFPGTSDSTLVDKVRPYVKGDDDSLREVPPLHHAATIRPVDILRALAVATRPRYESSVYDVYASWAVLRYIGVFDRGSKESCLLSEAGRRISGKQRSVLSEDIGIGMSAILAGAWLVGRDGRSDAVELVDVDVLLAAGNPWLTQAAGSSRRPDYLVMRKESRAVKIGFLECKGSRAPGQGVKQLGSAYDQLGALLVDGRPVRGLAVAATVADGGVRYAAIERMPPTLDEDGDPLRVAAVPHEWVESWVTADGEYVIPEFGSPAEVAGIANRSTMGAPVEVSVATALTTSWSAIADLAANEDALVRWEGSNRPNRLRDGRRQRQEFEVGGLRARGTANSVALPGGRLEASLGVLDYVDDALTSGSSADILGAQDRARNDARLVEASLDAAIGGDRVAAVGPDGSALVLRAL
jgi:hypothetical protein